MYEFLIPYFQLSHPLEHFYITQGFGERPEVYTWMKGHDALDLRASTGTPCFAVYDGVCTSSGSDIYGGKFVKIETDAKQIGGKSYKLEFLYYHLDTWEVIAGERVYRGQRIGTTDNTGNPKLTTAPHLHFRVVVYWQEGLSWRKNINNGFEGAIDPKPFFTYKPMAENPYNIPANTLIQLTEGKGGFALWSGEKFYVDNTADLLASWAVRNKGNTSGKTLAVAQVVWDSYKKFNLKNQPLS